MAARQKLFKVVPLEVLIIPRGSEREGGGFPALQSSRDDSRESSTVRRRHRSLGRSDSRRVREFDIDIDDDLDQCDRPFEYHAVSGDCRSSARGVRTGWRGWDDFNRDGPGVRVERDVPVSVDCVHVGIERAGRRQPHVPSGGECGSAREAGRHHDR